MLPEELVDKVLKGERRALAQAITLVESDLPQGRKDRFSLLQKILPHTGKAFRVGISGVPGVGKSTFIEALGEYALSRGKKIAVLAIDPSSPKTRGSILGDKTRMSRLGANPAVFIRPSPSGGGLGGVNPHTRESILLCEAAGFDLIFVETVGVGQLEADVVDRVDFTLLLLSPAGGDAIQGMKKGVLELVDMILVNKADGDLQALAYQMVKEFNTALNLKPDKSSQRVMVCSALKRNNIDRIFEILSLSEKNLIESGALELKRQAQQWQWFLEKLKIYLLEEFHKSSNIHDKVNDIKRQFMKRETLPPLAALGVIQDWIQSVRE